MRIAIFTDIHGNIEALKSILEDVKKENIDEIVCLGDTIGIGPKPRECLKLVISSDVQYVLGNHELYCLKGTEIDDEIKENERIHHKWQGMQVTEEQRAYLEKCPLFIEKEFNGKKVLFAHFLIDNNSKDQYPYYDVKIVQDGSINKIEAEMDYDLIVVGHEHKAFSTNKVYDIGSAGCRKDNKTRYAILDTDTLNIETKVIEFDRESFEKDLMEYEYPDRNIITKLMYGIEI